MAYFKLTRFNGIMPAIAPRLLSDTYAQTAKDIDFLSGRLVSTVGDVDSETLSNTTRNSVFFYRDTNWLQWDEDFVKVVPGPVPGDSLDRLYWTGQGTGATGYPRMSVQGSIEAGAPYPNTSYKLGVPVPAAPTSEIVTGTAVATETPIDVSYVITFVTGHGEEGPPSTPSPSLTVTTAETVQVNFSGSFPAGNYYTTGGKLRIYRSNTGSASTQFQFLAEVSLGSSSYTDDTDGLGLGEVVPSTTWIGPPDEQTALYPSGPLQGLIPLPMGVLAGFTGNRFCLSEMFVPHAWPINYRITIEEDIVAIASTGSGVIALTDGQPYFITGTDPSAMTATKIDLAQACINRDSVVDMGTTIIYAGPDGLCAVDGAAGNILTENMISPKQWNTDFKPSLIKAFRHENTYVAYWTDGMSHGGWSFDPRTGGELNISTLSSSSEVRGGFTNPKDNQLYLIVSNKLKKYRAAGGQYQLQFKSKKFVSEYPVSMAWISVSANTYPVEVKVYGDGALFCHYELTESAGVITQNTTEPSGISSVTIPEPLMRMPAKVAQEWEIEVLGYDINEFCLAQSIDEIRTV